MTAIFRFLVTTLFPRLAICGMANWGKPVGAATSPSPQRSQHPERDRTTIRKQTWKSDVPG